MAEADDVVAGVDVGGSKIAVLLVDGRGAIRGKHEVPTVVGEPQRAAEQISQAVREVCSANGIDLERVGAVGVGVPGRVQMETGIVSLALNLHWRDVPLRDRLQDLLGTPCAVQNDVRAAALGLVERRVLGDLEDLVYISVGTGIAAGVVLGGRLHEGASGLAGEIGHVIVQTDGAVCVCGLQGCLETVAAGPWIARRASHDPATTAAAVYEAAARGDPRAAAVVDEAGRVLGRAIHELALVLGVAHVCLGGGVTSAGEGFLAPLRRELDRLAARSELAREVLPTLHLLPREAEAGTWGAVLLARRHLVVGRGRRAETTKEVGLRNVPSPLTP